ncbi:uncharacterized mitochondrial protein-like protein [Tanacetum coccineum]
MSGTIPPIPPPLRINAGNTGSPNRVDTMPTTNDTINTTTTTNVAHERPSDIKDIEIATLRLKLNAFKELEGEKVNGTFTRLKCLLNDLENNGVIILQVEVNATKSEKGLVAESFDWDEESVLSEDEGTTKIKAFMAIAKEESFVRKADARSGQWVEITMKKVLARIRTNQHRSLVSGKIMMFRRQGNVVWFSPRTPRHPPRSRPLGPTSPHSIMNPRSLSHIAPPFTPAAGFADPDGDMEFVHWKENYQLSFKGDLTVLLYKKSQMELYMQNREHGRMILESVENGLLIWPTIEENEATNIILQGLPADIYSLVNHHRVAKDLWERVQLLMHGTSLTKQERECKLYDAFDKFTHIKGESLHKYYLRFTQLINDMNIYNMKMEQFQVNTKSLNSLPPEWSKFVTDVKLSPMNHQTSSVPQIAYQSPQVTTQPMTESPPRDDPIACLNKAMFFLTVVASSRVTVQQVQRRLGQNYSGTGCKSNATGFGGNNANGQEKVVKCYNCQGEGHMSRQCTQPKRPRNSAWYKDKAMLAEAQEAGQILDEEQLSLSDQEVPHSETYLNDMENQSVHAMHDLE